MLQEPVLLHDSKSGLPRGGEEVLPGHLVFDRRADWHLTLVEVDVGDAAPRPELGGERAQVRRSIGKVVKGVDDQDDVAGPRRQGRLPRPRQDGAHVLDPLLAQALPQDLDHARLDVDGVHPPPGSDGAGEAQREVARPRPRVAGDVSGPEPKRLHDPVRPLPLLPVGALEPGEVRRQVGRVAVAPAAVSMPRIAPLTVSMPVSVPAPEPVFPSPTATRPTATPNLPSAVCILRHASTSTSESRSVPEGSRSA